VPQSGVDLEPSRLTAAPSAEAAANAFSPEMMAVGAMTPLKVAAAAVGGDVDDVAAAASRGEAAAPASAPAPAPAAAAGVEALLGGKSCAGASKRRKRGTTATGLLFVGVCALHEGGGRTDDDAPSMYGAYDGIGWLARNCATWFGWLARRHEKLPNAPGTASTRSSHY